MGLLSNYITGIGMSPTPAWGQKRITQNLYFNLRNHFDEDYLICQEWTIDKKNLNAEIPDIVIFDHKPVAAVIIEICDSKQFASINKKILQLRETYERKGLKECFVYVYDKDEWHYFGNDSDPGEPDYSQLLDIYLSEFIND